MSSDLLPIGCSQKTSRGESDKPNSSLVMLPESAGSDCGSSRPPSFRTSSESVNTSENVTSKDVISLFIKSITKKHRRQTRRVLPSFHHLKSSPCSCSVGCPCCKSCSELFDFIVNKLTDRLLLWRLLVEEHARHLSSMETGVVAVSHCLIYFCPAGIFAPVSKISKSVDQTPSSVTSTPRTPRMDLASRLAGKTKKEKEKKEKEREKGNRATVFANSFIRLGLSVLLISFVLHSQPRRRRLQ